MVVIRDATAGDGDDADGTVPAFTGTPGTDLTADDQFPTLPVDTTAVRWGAVSDEDDMPNLYDHFRLRPGGTINLRLNEPGNTNRVGSKGDHDNNADTAEDYDDKLGRNQRQVVINEVMWARDNRFVGRNNLRTREQWIELRNMTTTPRAYSDIRLTTSKDHPAPAAETDRLSNVPAYNNTWDILGKGSDGVSVLAADEDKETFVSMERVDYHNKGGWNADQWASAVELFLPNYKGTPAAENRPAGVIGARTVAAATNPLKDKIIVNEIGLSEKKDYDWIELHNVSDSPVNLKNWTISLTTGYGNEDIIYRFRDNDNFPNGHHSQIIPAKGYLLLVFKDPDNSPLAVGIDVLKMGPVEPGEPGDQKLGHLDHKYLNVKADDAKKDGATGASGEAANGIPSDREWLIIVRSTNNSNFLQSSHHIQDVAGPGGEGVVGKFRIQDINKPANDAKKDRNPDGKGGAWNIWHTEIFPLQNQNHDDFLRRTLNEDSFKKDKALRRQLGKGGGQGWKKESFVVTGHTGVGYDRGETLGGTPGYPNNTSKNKVGDIDDGKVVISELMLTTDDGRFPQWLELHNTSKTNAVNLAADDGWRLVIENHDSGQWEGKRDLVREINFKNKGMVKSIPPNQTILVVSITTNRNSASSDRMYYPAHRVYSVYANDRSNFYMANRRAPFLNTNGFHIKLVDGKGTMSDEIGNLDGNNRTYDDPHSWNWPTDMTEDERRTSLIRLKNADKTHRMGTPDRDDDGDYIDGDMTGQVLPMGTKWRGNGMVNMGMNKVPAKYAGSAWVHASDVRFQKTDEYYYGSIDDIGTPGHTSNNPLPVELSHFRPTLENGEVVIRWTTESELNNAGFNILRSDARDGEYKQVNSELIEGAGTTGERNTYKWVDESAKPNVVYYYQIEDVSFAGERQTLQTTKLKGLISARGKATTTWGELKEVQ